HLSRAVHPSRTMLARPQRTCSRAEGVLRFSIEQVFLTDSGGKPLDGPPAAAYHVVEADDLDSALSSFLADQQSTILGTVRRFPGSQAVATAQQKGTVFTCHVAPGG